MNNENKTNWFKVYVIDVLPCITISLYVLGILYNQSFFNVFGINIINYVSLHDLFINIIDVLIWVALFSFLTLWGVIFFTSHVAPAMEIMEEEKKSKEKQQYKPRKSQIKSNTSDNEKSNIESSEHSWNVFMFSLTLMITSFIFFLILFKYNLIPQKMLGVSTALSIPFFMIAGTIFYRWLSLKIKFSFHNINIIRKYKTIEVVEFVLCYYIYAIFMCSYLGRATGEHLKKQDGIRFEITVSDGRIYNESKYGFISNFTDNVFLFEKGTNYNVILNKTSITSMKLDFHDQNTMSEEKTFL